MHIGNFHVHQVHMNDLVRILRRFERAAVRSLLGLGNVAGITFDMIG